MSRAAIFQISFWSSWGSLGKTVNSVSVDMLTDGTMSVRREVDGCLFVKVKRR